MGAEETLKRYSAQISRDHSRMRPALIEMARTVDALDQNHRLLHNLADQIDDLREELHSHFEREEQIAFHERLAAALPSERTTIAQLLTDHPVMLQMLRDVRDRAQHCRITDIAHLRAGVEVFLHLLYQHETTEDELLERASHRATAD